MIIEFYGLPGSGKSTIARRLAAGYGWTRVRSASRTGLLAYNALYLLRRPARFFFEIRQIWRERGGRGRFYHKLMNCFFDYNAKRAKAASGGKALLDQGRFQNVISLFDRPLAEGELKRYLAGIDRPDKLFVFSLDEALRKKRLSGRPARELAPGAESARLSNHQLFLRLLPELGVSYRVIDAARGEDAVMAEILESVKTRPD